MPTNDKIKKQEEGGQHSSRTIDNQRYPLGLVREDVLQHRRLSSSLEAAQDRNWQPIGRCKGLDRNVLGIGTQSRFDVPAQVQLNVALNLQ